MHYADSKSVIAFLACYGAYSVFTIKYSEIRRSQIRDQRIA